MINIYYYINAINKKINIEITPSFGVSFGCVLYYTEKIGAKALIRKIKNKIIDNQIIEECKERKIKIVKNNIGYLKLEWDPDDTNSEERNLSPEYILKIHPKKSPILDISDLLKLTISNLFLFCMIMNINVTQKN